MICDPHVLSDAELEKLTRRYTAEIIDFIGPERDVPAPDVNTNEQIMAWIMDTYSMHARHTVTAVVTGKPMALGGSRGRPEATGRGCMIVTLQGAEASRAWTPEDTRVVIQGFGNVGGMAAQLMARAGLQDHLHHRVRRRGLQPARPRHRRAAAAPQGDRLHHRLRRRRGHGPRRGHVPAMRRAAAGRHGERDHLAERRPAALQDPVRRRQRPHHAAGRRRSWPRRRSS